MPAYFLVDGAPVRRDDDGTVRAMHPTTGVMVPAAVVTRDEVAREVYLRVLDTLRQPIIERCAEMPLVWKAAPDVSYEVVIDGHRLTVVMGDFPSEPLYLVSIDGEPVFSVDDWPNAWTKP